jgi:hypothetical protein
MATYTELEKKMTELKAKRAAFSRLNNEGGDGYLPYGDEMIVLADEMIAVKKAEGPKFSKEEVTAMRADFNSAIRSFGRALTPTEVLAVEARIGVTRSELKSLVAHYGL